MSEELKTNKIIVVTTDEIQGYGVEETIGEVFGLVVRSRGLKGNLIAVLRSFFGGEIIEYTQMLEEARVHAMDRMVKNAEKMGANAILRMQFDSSEIGSSMTEIVAYGTAAVVRKK
jgi:uncharacterized protein YbjQ (UPF0145 family)